jgi:hypothetical protein
LCLACNPARVDAYLRRHGKGDIPHPDRHPFHTDDSGLTCARCELPDSNRIHKLTGGF